MSETQYKFGERNRPADIDAPPRESKYRVVAEVGVFVDLPENGEYSWKVIQRVETDSGTKVRTGFYKNSGDGWSWAQNALLLPPEEFNDLYAQAVTAGLFTP